MPCVVVIQIIFLVGLGELEKEDTAFCLKVCFKNKIVLMAWLQDFNNVY